jgi:oligopeptide/dipeptide ABC transporter ATP-binding protein
MSTLIEIKNLKVHFPISKQGKFRKKKAILKAVDGVSIKIAEGETLGLVGESGCGKTTLGKAIIRLIDPTGGDVVFHIDDEEVEMRSLNAKGLRKMWRNMKMIFQDPYASLNPRMTVSEIIGESLYVNGIAKGEELKEKVKEVAGLCGLNARQLGRYPHAFSGGQRQRVAIARALAMRPKFIVADEPVSSLDVSIQAQILNLLKDLQQEFNLTLLLVAHDLSAVAYVSDRVAVMYLGRVVELAETAKLYYTPLHPYTEALMSAIPSDNPELTLQPVTLKGEPPNPTNPPSGCAFHNRCNYADGARCTSERPELQEWSPGHFAACHYAKELSLTGAKKE